MDDKSDKPNVQAENNSIAIGEINISGIVTGNISIGHTIIQAADAQLRHDLGILLKNVETMWIKGVLEKSVHQAALLELDMEMREEAVENPWRMVMEGPDQARETLPQGRKVKDIFDEANRLLLILGEPGSGKTTTLLQLARDLIAEVDLAFTQPVPVILNLSTWTNKQQPLDEWLVDELNSKYRLPKKDGRSWLRDRRILPLLDGLDEVKAENRAACVEKINRLVIDYGLQGLVICSRIKDYMDLSVRLAFYRAIYLQPLTPEQIDEYLDRAGEKLASLRATLQGDEALKSMAQSPLILNIMSLAYQDTSAQVLSDAVLNTDEARRRHLFDTYIARMFHRKVGVRQYGDEQTKQHLSWLARNMQRHNQEVFLIESLQPSWLQAEGWQWLYLSASQLVTGIMVGLHVASPLVTNSFFVWLAAGLVVGFIDLLRFVWHRKSGGISNFSELWLSIARIKTIETWQWSVGKTLKGGLIGAIVALSIGLVGSLTVVRLVLISGREVPWIVVEKPWLGWLNLAVSIALSLGPIFVLFGAFINGLRPGILETKSRPNEGIIRTLRNTLLVATISELIGIFIYDLAYGGIRRALLWVGMMNLGASTAAIISSSFAPIAALWYGGLDVIQHYTLRLILVIQGHTHPHYAQFLDYAVDRIILQKVGGGYRFIHRLLLEHFADMDTIARKV